MQLRPRQAVFVDRFCEKIEAEGNTLGIAPTGAGKTVMLASTAQRLPSPGLVLQHVPELVTQNSKTFFRCDRSMELGFYLSDRKRIARDGWTFGMMQTVVNHLDELPPFKSVLIDEAHHVTSDSYLKILAALKRANPDILVGGVTATPKRGDKRTLKAVFSNVADAITLRELISGGFLVKPKAFVIDVGVQEQLRDVRKKATDFDMDQVAEIMDSSIISDQVVAKWKEMAGDRRTVVFCANTEHATHTVEAFKAAGVDARAVTGDTKRQSQAEREAVVAAFDRGDFPVIVNVAVLTEGWDCQPVSCVVLLRPSSHISTMIQMIGRGLRIVDPEKYPDVTKHDCIVLDFGTSLLTHGSIEDDGDFGGGDTKECPECQSALPGVCRECPLCGYSFPHETTPVTPRTCTGCGHENSPNRKLCEKCGQLLREPTEKEALGNFVLTELELFEQSPFKWEELWGGVVFMACAFDAWAAVINYNGEWFAVGGSKEGGIRSLAARTEKLVALAQGDDWMREHASTADAGKGKRWLTLPPSEGQLKHLGMTKMQAMGMTRYRAACLMTWRWSDRAIQAKVKAAADGKNTPQLAA
jgi:superfamily II DNA or RNA helicase